MLGAAGVLGAAWMTGALAALQDRLADLLAEAGLDEVYVLAPTASLAMARPRAPLELAERVVRRWLTFALCRETARLRASWATVTVLTPGPEDLRVIGANLMDPGRRRDMFETSLRTSARSLAHLTPDMSAAA